MGNTHTRRNKRGGRHNRGAAPRPAAANAGASASVPVRPSETPAPAVPPERSAAAPAPAPPTSDAPAPPRRARSASEPSLRAPYAPGQRASRGPRRSSAPSDEPRPAELEVTATYEEIVVIAQGAELLEDAENERDSRDAGDYDGHPPAEREPTLADADQEHHAHRHNGQSGDASRRNGHARDRDRNREHDQSYTPAHLRPAFEHDGTRANPEAEPAAEAGRDASAYTPRGDVRGDVGPLIDDLRTIFQHDRATASATGGTRCGICYLHFALDALEYRDDEGYYVCTRCAQALGTARVPMVRRQKRG